MPTIKLVMYDMRESAGREALAHAIEQVYGRNAVHLQFSAWLIWTAQSGTALYDAIRQYQSDSDRLWVSDFDERTLAAFTSTALDGTGLPEWFRKRGVSARDRAA